MVFSYTRRRFLVMPGNFLVSTTLLNQYVTNFYHTTIIFGTVLAIVQTEES
jgi:hypothetical protein